MRYDITAIGDEPLALQEVKDHLSLDTSDFDDLLEGYISAARVSAEQSTDRTLIQKRVVQYWDKFPDSGGAIELDFAPVRTIQSVKYVDADGATQTWASSNYRTDLTEGMRPRITEAFSASWPSIRDLTNAVWVTYDVGPKTPSDIPRAVRVGMLLEIASYFNTREDSVKRLPTAAGHLYATAKRTWL